MTIFYCPACEAFENIDGRAVLKCPICKAPMQSDVDVKTHDFKEKQMTNTIIKPFTHERCDCGFKRKIIPSSSGICPDCGKPTYRVREIIPALEHQQGKTNGNKVSEGKGQQVFTLPKKLVGATDPSPEFLGIQSNKGENK